MGRIGRVVASLGLITALQGMAVLGIGPALASDDDKEESEEATGPGVHPDFEVGDVSGIVYKVSGDNFLQVVTIYNKDIGLGVDSYVREPVPLALVKSKEVCVGRFVTAQGIRTGPTTMDVQGFIVDPTTKCGTPPK